MAHLRGLLIAWTLVLALLGAPASRSHAQPADESADAMNARLAAATLTRVGPSYLYPAHASASGLVNPDITQAKHRPDDL